MTSGVERTLLSQPIDVFRYRGRQQIGALGLQDDFHIPLSRDAALEHFKAIADARVPAGVFRFLFGPETPDKRAHVELTALEEPLDFFEAFSPADRIVVEQPPGDQELQRGAGLRPGAGCREDRARRARASSSAAASAGVRSDTGYRAGKPPDAPPVRRLPGRRSASAALSSAKSRP